MILQSYWPSNSQSSPLPPRLCLKYLNGPHPSYKSLLPPTSPQREILNLESPPFLHDSGALESASRYRSIKLYSNQATAGPLLNRALHYCTSLPPPIGLPPTLYNLHHRPKSLSPPWSCSLSSSIKLLRVLSLLFLRSPPLTTSPHSTPFRCPHPTQLPTAFLPRAHPGLGPTPPSAPHDNRGAFRRPDGAADLDAPHLTLLPQLGPGSYRRGHSRSAPSVLYC